IYVVQDNCPSVHKHPTVLQTAKELGIVPLFLPTYASWLNPIEKLWRWLKADVLHNHPWAHDLGRLRQETATFLDQFHHPNEALLAYVGLLPV
ncbi:MAG: transposase, partial [Anaerolineales bacterium]|nr:transposase [Anaerolineales bacterium]